MKKTKGRSIILPQPLARGDAIGLVTPAGPVVDREAFDAGVEMLAGHGFRVKTQGEITAGGYLAGPDDRRAEQFRSLWADPEVKALVAVRGGYGSLRMVRGLDMVHIRRYPKIFIGFSDITVLLTAILKEAGLLVYHGPMLTTLPRCDDESIKSFFSALTEHHPAAIKPESLEILIPGRAHGRLTGGNLASLTHLLATPFEIPWQKRILFIEEVNEPPYRVDRMLTHLYQAGRLQGLAGLILGDFKDCGEIKVIRQRVIELVGEYNIPVWANFPAGHGRRNLTLPLGLETEMDSGTGSLRFTGP